jgi:hypothetical protein
MKVDGLPPRPGTQLCDAQLGEDLEGGSVSGKKSVFRMHWRKDRVTLRAWTLFS